METYTLSPAERRARAQALREQRENRYQYKKYFEEKAAIEQQQRQAELDIKNAESQRKGADFFTRTISTLGDVAGNIITGALKGIEGIYDLGAGIVGAVGGMFSDEFSEGVKNHIAYDAIGQWVGNPIAEMTKYSYIYDTSDTFQNITRGVASGVGQILPAVAVSILTAGAGAPAAIASLASSATFIAGAAGRGTEEAFNEGADFYQGLGYGILTGAVEGAIEKLSGGVSKAFMGKGLIDDVIKGTTKKITTNAVAQKGLQILIEAGGEGAEEWVSELVNPYLKRMTYNSEAELSTSKSRLEAALIGGLTSLAYSGSIGRIGAKSRNVSENLAEINTLKAKEENLWGNGKLDNEKATNIKTSIDNNYLEISKSLVKASEKSRANIIKKFKLESKFNTDGTLVNEDVETVASNTQKPNLDIVEGQTDEDRQMLETPTTAEIKPLASPVAYNREAYSPSLVGKEVDLAFKPTIESLTDAQIKARQDFTKLNKGKVKARLVFTNELSVDSDGNIQDGAYKNGILYINTKANAAEVVVKHELSHFAEGTKAYMKYADFVLREINSNEAMTKKFGNLIEKINETSNLYKAVNQGKDISQEQREVLTEVIAQYTSKNLFTNEEQINRLARVDRNFFQKVVDWFKDTIGNFQHKKNLSKEEKETVDFLKRAEKLYSKALGEAWGASDHTNYSLSKDRFDANKKKWYNNYNQYDTLAKQWAFSPKTKAGDKKVLFNAKTNEYNLIIATKDDNGFAVERSIKGTERNVDIIESLYEEERDYGNRKNESIYEIIDEVRTPGRRSKNDLHNATESNSNGQDDGFYRRESQRDGNKGKSNGNADTRQSNRTSKDGVKYSLKHSVDKITNASELKAAQSKIYELRIKRNLESREYKDIINSEEYKRVAKNESENSFDINAKLKLIEELTQKIGAYDAAIEEYHKNLILERKKGGEDFAESHRKKAVKEYGYTLNFNEAGYILPNGKMLNFSGGEKGQHFGYRGQDHRDIRVVFEEGELGDSASDSLILFMSEGNIRMMPESPGVDICREPSSEQLVTIRNFVSKFAFENEYFNIDFSNEKGDVVNSIEYEYKVSGTKVVNDIKYYFEKGEVPKQSATAQFRYSLKTNKDNLGNELSNKQQEYFMDSKVVDSNGNLYVVYHGTKQEFNVFDINKLGDNTGLFTEGVGFYFTENEDVANSYTRGTNKKHKVYLNITKPMLVNQNKFTKDIRKKIFLELYKIDDNALSNYSDVAYEGINLAVKEALKIESSNETDLDFIASLVNGGVTKSQTILNTVTKITGYDGVINNGITTSTKKDYKVFVAFNPNQIKLTSNQNPTQNEDIRYSLSNGEVKKIVANKTKLKSYTKEDAEVIINGVMSHYMAFGDKYGDLSSKTKRQAITLLWEGLNTADKGYQASVALDIANYIIENSVMEDMYADNDNTVYIDVIRLLKPYLHKIDLSSLKGEIAHKYDKDKSVYALWGKRKGEKGYGADQVGQELLDFGMQIEATNEADIFFEIDSAYRKAVNSLKKQAKIALKDMASPEELKKLKQDIAREILIGYDKQGTETAFGKTIKKYIKQIQLLKGQVKDLKERNKALNNLYESIDKLKGLEKYQKADIELADEVLGLIKLLKKVKTYRGNLSQNVRDIMIAYSKEVDGKKLYDIIANAGNGIDNPVAQLIEDIAHKNGDLSTQELRNLDLIMQNAIHNINNYDKVFFEGKTQEDTQIVEKAIKETKESKKVKDSGVGGSFSKFSRWLTAPIWRFQRLCSYRKNGIMSKVFTEFQNGVSRQAEFNMEVAEHYKEFFKKNKKVASDWNKATFDVGSVKLSRGQIMSLYMLSLREQAKGHLFNDKGGSSGTIRITDDTIANKGRFSEALTKGQDVTISQDVIDSIEKSLTLEEKEFISLTQEFFNKIAKKAKVDTDMALFGISNAIEDNYIPIRVSDDQLYKQIGDEQSVMSFKSLFSVYTPSFNKDVKPNSKNKIVVENIIDIVNRHAKQMSAYYGLAVPVKTFNRLYNKTLDNGEKLSVEIAKMDSEFERYVGKLLSDMQGNVKEKTGFDHALGKIRGWGAKAALGLNLKVLANQFVSLPAAAAIGVKYKSIAKGFTKAVSRKTDFDILVKYCPMLYDRFREGNNIDVGLLKENQGVLGKVDALTNLTTLPIGKIDKFVCGAVWNSCLEQTKNSTAYTNYSDEHYKAAAKLTEEAVIKTQANYLALYRPAILREQNSLLQLSTMFMSEPLQQFSLLASALDKIKVAKALLKNATASADIAEAQELLKNSKTEARHAITAVAIDSILLVLIAQAFKWVKGKEDDDKVEGIVGDFTENFVGMLPFVRDIYSLLQGYDVTNMAYSGLTNITNGAKEMYSIIDLLISGKAYSNSEITGGLRKTLLGISQTFGIPLRNLETYVKGIVEKFSPSATYKYDNFFYNKTSSNYTKDLRKAMDNGDEKLSDTILDLMLEEEKVGVKDSNTRKIIKDLYEQGFNVLPKSISTTITYDNEKIALTKNQLKQFKTIYEEGSDDVKTLTQSDKFLAALPEVQAKSIKFVYDYYYNLALEDLLGIDLESKNMLFAKAINISDLSVVVSSIKAFETTIDKRGNTVQGSKKAKVQTYVNSLKLNAAQKYMLMGYCGYSNSKGDIRVKQYIQSLKLTKKQKETLFTMSGYEKSKA